MKSCNTQAGAEKLTGDARKAFMSDGLAGRTTTGSGNLAGMTQQEKMKLAIYHMVVRARAPNPDGAGRRRWF